MEKDPPTVPKQIGEEDFIKQLLKNEEAQYLIARSRCSNWMPQAQELENGTNMHTWGYIAKGLVEDEKALSLAVILMSLGKPAQCLNITINDITREMRLRNWVLTVDEGKERVDADRDRVARMVLFRLQELKLYLEKKEGKLPESTQKRILRLNSYKGIPKLNPKDWPTSFGILESYMNENSVDPADYLEILRRAAPDDNFREHVAALDKQWSKLGSMEWIEVKRCFVREADKAFTSNTIHDLCRHLRPFPGETMVNYGKRYRWHLDFLPVNAKEAGELFQDSLPSSFQVLIANFQELKGEKMEFEEVVRYLNKTFKKPHEVCYVEKPIKYRKLEGDEWNNNKERGLPLERNIGEKRKRESQKSDKKKGACYVCGKEGHYARECSDKKVTADLRANEGSNKKRRGEWKDSKDASKYSRVDSSQLPDLVDPFSCVRGDESPSHLQAITTSYNHARLGESNVTTNRLTTTVALQRIIKKSALLDTGSDASVISKQIVKELRSKGVVVPSLEENVVTVTYANNTQESAGLVELHIQIGPHSKEHVFYVVEQLSYPVVIGLDLIRNWNLLALPTLTVEGVKAHLEKLQLADLEKSFTIEEHGVVLQVDHTRLMGEINQEVTQNLETSTSHSTIGEIAIIFKNQGDRRKGVWRHQVSMSSTAMAFYQKQVKDWMEQNIVEPMIDLPDVDSSDCGPFNINGFPIYSGKERIVHNFKPLNDLIEDDTCDVPGINDTFERIARLHPIIYSKLDLKSAYLQIPLRTQDKPVCAFTCDNKRYRFVTAPLGLKTIPSQFQRWIKGLLQLHDCLEFSSNHIDDIIIYSNEIKCHISHVKKVLTALSSVKLTINLEKCIFFATKLPVLGFWLEVGGMRPNTAKICNMLDWVRPNTRKKVQSFIGTVNFFRRFIPNATELLMPIMSIRKRRFNWLDQPGAEQAYVNIFKALITNGPFISFPVSGVPIELATDASEHGIGAILFQVLDGEVKYLGFNSRILKDAEQRYSIPKKELISILYHIKYYRDWLIGSPFKLHTDSQALTSVLKELDRPKKNSILVGWLAELAEYAFEVHHIKGKENILPDLASRVQAMEFNHNTPITSQEKWTEKGVEELLERTHKLAHWGATNMYRHITITLGLSNIPHLLKKCQEYTKKCDACLRVNSYYMVYAPPREPQTWLPMQYIHIDLMEVNRSRQGYKYILVMVDQMTGFSFLFGLLTKQMDEVSYHVLDVFSTFGYPFKMKSDNGMEFCNNVLKEVLNRAKVQHVVTVAYDHHANGVVERMVRATRDTLEKMIRSLGEENYRDDWEVLLPHVQFGLNTRINRVTGVSPFSLMFGRSAFSHEGPRLDGIETSAEDLKNFWNTFQREIPDLITGMRKRSSEKEGYRHKTGVFNVGDVVYHRIPRTSKNEDQYQGPFEITKRLGNGNYLIQKDELELESPANFLKRAKTLAPKDTPTIRNNKIVEEINVVEGVNELQTFDESQTRSGTLQEKPPRWSRQRKVVRRDYSKMDVVGLTSIKLNPV